MNYLKLINGKEPGYRDKKRTTFYLSSSLYKKFKKVTKKAKAKSTSAAIENIMEAIVLGD